MPDKVLALDPSLTHSSLVEVVWDGDTLISWQELFAHSKKTHEIGIKSGAIELVRVCEDLLAKLPPTEPGTPIAIDYDFNSGMWGGGQSSTTRFSFMVGYLYHGMISRGYAPVLISPYQVRKSLGLTRTKKKTDVINYFIEKFSLPFLIPQKGNGVTEDLRDSVLLSYVLHQLKRTDTDGDPPEIS